MDKTFNSKVVENVSKVEATINERQKLGYVRDEAIQSIINQRRRQMCVHSYMYYTLMDSVVDDKMFDGWAYELVAFQTLFPEIAKKCVYAKEFLTFDGSTGMDLPKDNKIYSTCVKLLMYHGKWIKQDQPNEREEVVENVTT